MKQTFIIALLALFLVAASPLVAKGSAEAADLCDGLHHPGRGASQGSLQCL